MIINDDNTDGRGDKDEQLINDMFRAALCECDKWVK